MDFCTLFYFYLCSIFHSIISSRNSRAFQHRRSFLYQFPQLVAVTDSDDTEANKWLQIKLHMQAYLPTNTDGFKLLQEVVCFVSSCLQLQCCIASPVWYPGEHRGICSPPRPPPNRSGWKGASEYSGHFLCLVHIQEEMTVHNHTTKSAVACTTTVSGGCGLYWECEVYWVNRKCEEWTEIVVCLWMYLPYFTHYNFLKTQRCVF